MTSEPDRQTREPAPGTGASIATGTRCSRQWRILVATDGSECACEAQEFLASFPFSEGTAVHVVGVAADPFRSAGTYGDPGFVCWHLRQEVLDAEQEHVAEAVRSAVKRLRCDHWKITSETTAGEAAHEVVLAARRFQANLVLVGTRGRAGISRVLLGSTARSIARHVPCSVLVGHTPRGPLRQVVLAVDGSEYGCLAVRKLAAMPLPEEACVTVLHVARPFHSFLERLGVLRPETGVEAKLEGLQQKHREAAEQLVANACHRLEAAGKHARAVVRCGDAAEEILKLSRTSRADLLVAGARGSSVIPEALVGSVAARALQCAPCSVLIVR
jgi:hypothetical protein